MNPVLPIFLAFLLFLSVAMVWPTWRVWRLTGHNPVVLPSDDSVEGFVGLAFKLVIVALGFYLGGLAAGWFGPIGPIDLAAPAQRWLAGWALIAASVVWVVAAQWQMGASWRVGIDRSRPAALVRSGAFRYSRNPIFLGMMVQLAGLVLLQPDAITVVVLICAYLMISVQIRLEEQYLRTTHASAYDAYAASVRRWI